MLPTDLLLFRVRAGLVEPRRLKPTTGNLGTADMLIQTFEAHRMNIAHVEIRMEGLTQSDCVVSCVMGS